jgi:lipid-binding SYLF domain-containing protein
MKVQRLGMACAPVLGLILAFSSLAAVAEAATKAELDAAAKAAMDRFQKDVKGSAEFLKVTKGALVVPNIIKAGFVIGGQYGEGALQIAGKNEAYYSFASGSVGWQIGAEKYDLIILFLTDEALQKFRDSKGWEAGADASVTVVSVGAEGTVETLRSQSPVVGFVLDQKGLMAGVSVKGAKFTKIEPK